MVNANSNPLYGVLYNPYPTPGQLTLNTSKSAFCHTIGRVHCWHRRRIECLDTKTLNEEDLPFIEKCCRCDFEQEIQKTQIISQSPTKIKRRLLPGEIEEADSVMKIYNEKRQKKIQAEALKFAANK